MYSSYLNSKESISSAIKTGAKVIEIDVCLTNDNIPVLSHRFEPDGEIMFFETPSVKEFLETPLPNSNTSLTLESMLSEFKDFDGYFLVDCAFGAEKFVSEWLVKNLSEKQRHHIVFQVHEINFLKSLTERKVFEFLHYNADIKTLEQISPILIACNVHSVSVDDHEIKDLRTLSKLNKSGIHVYAYTVNHKRRFDFLMNAGASGIFSDRLFYKENVQ